MKWRTRRTFTFTFIYFYTFCALFGVLINNLPSSNLCFNKPVCQSLLSVYFPLQDRGKRGRWGRCGCWTKALWHRSKSGNNQVCTPRWKPHETSNVQNALRKVFSTSFSTHIQPLFAPLPCARVECATWRGNSCSTLGFNSQPENLELFQCICERDSDILHMLLDCSIKGNAVEGGGRMLIWAD